MIYVLLIFGTMAISILTHLSLYRLGVRHGQLVERYRFVGTFGTPISTESK
jgi:hypothetical protein